MLLQSAGHAPMKNCLPVTNLACSLGIKHTVPYLQILINKNKPIGLPISFQPYAALWTIFNLMLYDSTTLIGPSIRPSVRHSISPSVRRSIHLVNPLVHQSIRLSIHHSTGPSVYQSVCPSICASIHRFIRPFVYRSISPSVHHTITL